MNCPICNKRPVPSGYTTCGNSVCQEIRYLRLRQASVRSKVEKRILDDRIAALEESL